MPRTWATWGGDLQLDLSATRVRAGLERELREAVRGGRLRPGTRVPSSRALAADLGIARNTVGEAYAQLVAEGWLASKQGAGTWVADCAPPSRPVLRTSVEPTQARYDLRPGMPDVSAFPRAAWLSALRRALVAAPASVLDYGDPRGQPRLRTALSDYLARARGVSICPDRLVICAGFAQGLSLVSEVLKARGATTLAIESYGLPQARHIVETSGLRTLPLPIDQDGAQLERLDEAQAALLTPAHQFPIGVALEPARRLRAVRWAVGHDAVIIEDDYDGEFRYDRRSVGAMQSLAPEHVVYAGTASKSLAPGIRLAWLVPPARLLDDIVSIKAATVRLSGSLDQLALAELIASGGYDRHIRRARLAYRRRRDRLVSTLRQQVPRVTLTGIAAGLHVLVELPPGACEDDVVARAQARGLSIEGLDAYRLGDERRDPALVVGYGRPPEHAFTAGLARLCAVLSDISVS